MSPDLRTLLHETASQPRQPVDVDELFGRVERRRTGRRTAGVAGVVAVIAVVLGVSQLVGDQQPVPLIGETDDAAGACAGGEDGQTVAAIDIDGDGLQDRARLNDVDQLLVVCLGNGQTARGSTDDSDYMGPTSAVEAVDLGGVPGIALIRYPDAADPLWRDVVFVRWFEGRLAVMGGNPDPGPGELPELGRGEHFGEQLTDSGPETYGCRPSTTDRREFEIVQIGWNYAQTSRGDGLRLLGSPGIDEQVVLDSQPRTVADLYEVLRDEGFTPRCLPEGALPEQAERVVSFDVVLWQPTA